MREDEQEAAAIAGGLSEEAGRYWARRGAIHEVAGVPTVVEALDRPDASVPTTRATPLVADRVADSADGWASYTAAARALAPERRLFVRLPLAIAKTVIDWGAQTVLVRVESAATGGPVAPAEPEHAAAITVTSAVEEPAGWAFVGALLVESLRVGMPGTEFDAASQCEWLDGSLRIGRPDGAVGWVARVDGAVRGTVAARLHTDPLTRRPEVELIDAFAIGPQRRAVQDALVASVREWAATIRPGAPLVSKVIGEDGREFNVLDKLEAAGWEPTWSLVTPP